MKSQYDIEYTDFAQELKCIDSPDYSRTLAKGHQWGSYHERNVAMKYVRIQEAHIHLNQKFKVKYTDQQMDNEVHFCANLKGRIDGYFCDGKITKSLAESQHHYIYAPAARYELHFEQIHYMHLAIDRGYYLQLLNSSEEWLTHIRTRLQNQQEIYPGGITLHHQMKTILINMMDVPLTGNLRELMLEAKILELIALQLGQYYHAGAFSSESVSRKDREVFHAIHEYLAKTFNEAHSLQSLSRQFGINEFKLKQGFRDTFGTSVFAHIFDLKMRHAHHLIAEENMLLREVSREVGYKNPNHFSTAFKKRFGFSPNELKN